MPKLPEPPQGLEARCDTILANLLTALAPIQAACLAANGHYWQGIRSHVTSPADGNKTAPDRGRRPTDQAESWADAGVPLPATMEIATAVDVYDGPVGCGYLVVGEIEIAGRCWRKAIGVGPEVRSHDWQQVTITVADV